MKALSLTQPWATLVALGAKRFETRSWATSYRGRLAIHASKGFPRDCQELVEEEPFRDALEGKTAKDLPCGAVLCVVDLVNCFPVEDLCFSEKQIDHRPMISAAEECFGDYSPGRFAWRLRLVEVFLEPIPAKGALGLWEWEGRR